MLRLLGNSKLLTCQHAELVTEIASVLAMYKHFKDFTKSDFPVIAGQLIDFIGNRCEMKEAIPLYGLFVLDKIEVAFNVVVSISKEVIPEDEQDAMLDIPIEDFLELQIDEEFVRKINNE